MIVDGTECPVERPLDDTDQRAYYSGKKKKHTIKYEVAVDTDNAQIVWVAGGVPGSVHDLTLLRSSGLLNLLLPDERVCADKGYVGGPDCLLVPFKGAISAREEMFNRFLSKYRTLVENVNARFKYFACLRVAWRHELTLHSVVFHLITNIVNVDCIYRPVRRIPRR